MANVQLINFQNTLIFNKTSSATACFPCLKQLKAQFPETCTFVWSTKQQSAQPLRSCLQDDDNCKQKSISRKKKTVIFADEKGLQLTHVRFFKTSESEANMIKNWLKQRLHYTSLTMYSSSAWKIHFPQPYLKLAFYSKLDNLKVSLDRFIVKKPDNVALGTIKVKNLAFEKNVFIRSTDDLWVTQLDTYCNYVNSDSNSPDYDVFSFEIKLPIHAKTFEFCIGFKCINKEFWDNNFGRNYLLTRN